MISNQYVKNNFDYKTALLVLLIIIAIIILGFVTHQTFITKRIRNIVCQKCNPCPPCDEKITTGDILDLMVNTDTNEKDKAKALSVMPCLKCITDQINNHPEALAHFKTSSMEEKNNLIDLMIMAEGAACNANCASMNK